MSKTTTQTTSKLKHRGVHGYRLQDTNNRREIVFSKQWREINRLDPDFLSTLLGRTATQEDATVAATIIQYLGTKSGFMELEEMIKKSTGYVKL